MLDLGSATLETFSPHVGSAFVLEHPETSETFTLKRAEALKSFDHPMKKRDPFSLFFHGARTDIQFNQQILPLKHEALGEMEIFLVPLARNGDGTILYQALFN